ncbi:hypothetical protein [Mesonia mobilis]|uniref:Uncharacterized protein n=1 Tax=Mesonia mobilis TaxID=369791 RepID=A0ABQ3BQP9_9FLAO|nr:hypothetical protein [Mesonia mobilis]MBQ0738312.1 hypothetical protein [Aquimarina celericrescens]GGZ50027.1 hypothetical protein GCM10008088_09390 [Mesonia mobilis]
MNNPKAQKLIKKILDDLDHAGIITNTLVEDLKLLRPYAVEEKLPVVAKALRLTYEHLEENYTFDIPIPEDEPIEGEEEEFSTQEFSADESLMYLINLIKNAENPMNIEEIREYNEALQAYED